MMRAWTFALIATAVLCAIVPLDGQAYAAAPRPLGWGVRYVTQAYDDEDMATAAGLREHWVRITVATQEASPCQQASCNLYIRLEQLQVVVQVEPVDLNDDGAPELLLRSSLCEATGCPYALVMRRSGTWRDMLNPMMAQNIVVNAELSGALKSLSVTSQRPGYDVIDHTTYVWDGVGYVPNTGRSSGQTSPFGAPAGPGRFGTPGGASAPAGPIGSPNGSSGSSGSGSPFGSPSGGLPAPRPTYQTKYAITPKAATIGEGDGTFVFQLTRVGDLPAETVYVSTVIGAKSGFAVNANDYKGKKNEPVVFGEGGSSQPVTLIVYPETLDDGDKTFGLLVERAPGAANNAVLATEKFTIRDDDEAAAVAPVTDPTLIPGANVYLWSVQKLESWRAAGAALTYAKLSDAAYKSSRSVDGWTLVADWTEILARSRGQTDFTVIDRWAGKVRRSGFASAVYERDGEYVLVFRGSDDLGDWFIDFTQLFGSRGNNQYDFALTIATMARNLYGSHLIVTGHSLGGGLAQYVAWRLPGTRAVTFNAAGLGGVPESAGHLPNVVNVVVERDPVSRLATQMGRITYEIPNPIEPGPWDMTNAHGGFDGATNVISALNIFWSEGALRQRRLNRQQ